jgi:hypothetical protein
MRSQFIQFILLNVIVQATFACSQQPNVIASSPQIAQSDVTPPKTTAPAESSIQKTVQADTSVNQPRINTGTYNLGSSYITVASQGDRTCYQGISIPSGRYAVAVGETTGSLSAEKNYLVVNGWKKYGKTIALRQNGEDLSIAIDGDSPSEYSYFQADSREKYSESLINCLNSSGDFFETASGYTIVSSSNNQSNQATGNLLSSEQKAKLLQLPIPIIAPTFLPEGFRLVQATGEANKYANGDDDSGYMIAYQGDNNTCISISSSSSGSRGLQRVNQVKTEFGTVDIYTSNARDNSIQSIASFITLKGNPALISGGSIPDRNADGGFKTCNPISLGQYIQVLKSLTLVK